MRKSKQLSFEGRGRKNSKKIKSFIIAFSAFVVLLGSASLLLFMKHLNYDFSNLLSSAQTTTEEYSENTTEAPALEGIANVLAVCENTQKELEFVCIVTADYAAREISVCPVRTDMRVAYDGSEAAVSEIYSRAGAVGLRDAVSQSLGIGTGRYLKFNVSQLRSFLNKFEDIEVEVPEDIDDSSNGLILNKGKNALSSELFIKYIHYADPFYKADAFAQLISTVLSERHAAKLETLFSYIANNSQTDITIVDYKAHEERLLALASGERSVKAVEASDAVRREADD